MRPASDDPLYSGELRARAELTFAAILRTLLVVVPVTAVANQLGAGTTLNSLLLALAWLYVGALMLLQRRGHFALCVHGTVFGLIVFSALIAAVYGSVRSAGTLGQVVAITVGALFLTRRAMVAAAALSIGSIALLIYGELAGWLPRPAHEITTAHWVIYAMIIAAVALVLSYMRTMLIDLVRQLGSELLLRQAAEASRQQSEDRFRRVFESSPVGMTITRASDGRFLDINRADQRTLGYPREELIGRRSLDMGTWLAAEDRERFMAALRERKGVQGYETRMRNKAGELVHCRIYADLVELDGEECVLSSTVNVTEHERAELGRRQSEAKYVAVFNSAPDPIAIARERDAVQLDVNDAWLRHTGFAREQAVGRSALQLGLWAEAGQRERLMDMVRAQGAIDNAPARFRIANGQLIDVLLSGIRVTLDGEPCVVWSWREVTQLRRAQAQAEQSRAKFQGLFDISPEGIAVTRWKDAVLIEANDAALAQIRMARQDAVGHSALALGIGAGAEDNAAIFAQLRAEGRVVNRSTRFRRHDGIWLEFLLSAATLTLDGEKCVVWSWRDQTEQLKQQRALAESEERFEKAFHASQEAIGIARLADTRIVSVNRRMEELFGAPAAELIGRTAQELGFWAEGEGKRLEIVRQLKETRSIRNMEVVVRSRNGELRTCNYSAELLDLGDEPHVIGFLRDITEQRRAERALRDTAERLRKVFRNSPAAIALMRFAPPAILDINEAYERLFGWPRDEALGRDPAELNLWVDAADRDRFRASIAAEGRVDNYVSRARRRGGEIIDTLNFAEIVEESGEKLLLVIVVDITERKRAEEELRTSRHLLESVIDAIPMSIFAKDLDSNYIMLNKRMADFFRVPKEQLLRQHTSRLPIDGATRNKSLDDDQWVFRNLRTLDQPEVLLAGPDGKQILYHSTKIPLFDDAGKPMGLLGINRDITEEHRIEEARRHALESFAAAFTNTPDGIVISRLRDAVIVDVNQAWLANNGFRREQVVGHTMAELGVWSEEERAAYIEKLNGEGRVTNFLANLRRADGRLRQTLLSAIRIERDGESCVMSMGRDITEMRRIEAERRQALARFDQVFSASPDSISITRVRDSVILAVNDAWLEANAYAREEVVGKRAQDLGQWMPGERESVMAQLKAEGRVSNRPATFRRADGTYRHALISVAKIEVDGEPCTLFMGRDITSQKAAEEALRDSEHRYRSLFQAAMDCILVISPGGTIIDANDYGCRSLGYTREELLGGSFARILDESKLSRMLPRPPHVKLERRTLRAEQDLRAKDGSLRSVEFTAGPLPDGNVLVVVRDITERRRNEKLLENIARGVSSQTGAEFFRTLVKALCRELPADTAFIGELTSDGRHVRTIACCQDGKLVENFEYPLEGSPCKLAIERRGTIVHPAHAARDFPEDQGLVRRDIEGYAGTSLYDAAGKALGIVVALTRAPIERKDFVVAMLEIFAARAAAEIERSRADAMVRELNISLERRVRERTAELEAANKDLDSFGYSVSHDLRSPLGALNGFAHLLRAQEAERLSADGVHLLRQLETNATRMTKLVEGLLEFSRLGRKPVTRIPVPMAALVSEVVDDLRAEIGERDVEFRIGAVPETYGDPMLLRQVWKNLIGNAVKYSRKREHAVVEVGFDEASREYFVRDNGAGFDMQYAERLFGVFERLHSESEFEGTGVGLAIVQRIVRRHGGVIRGEGSPERGATFRFTVPER